MVHLKVLTRHASEVSRNGRDTPQSFSCGEVTRNRFSWTQFVHATHSLRPKSLFAFEKRTPAESEACARCGSNAATLARRTHRFRATRHDADKPILSRDRVGAHESRAPFEPLRSMPGATWVSFCFLAGCGLCRRGPDEIHKGAPRPGCGTAETVLGLTVYGRRSGHLGAA